MDTIAERVEFLRHDRGWTKAELSRRSGLHPQHIYKVLTGQRKHVTADTLAALARVFGVSADYLLGLQDDIAPTPKKRTRTASPVA